MSRNLKMICTLFAVGLLFSCKDSVEGNEGVSFEEKTEASTTSIPLSSSAAVVDKSSSRKFIRTADVKFKVKSVTKSTYAIEETTSKFGGFVVNTNLASNVMDENRTEVSPDSTLISTTYKVENNISIRIPNTKLDTVLKIIGNQIHFLDYRIIKADDVSLQMHSNQLAIDRSKAAEKRIKKAIDSKGKKLTEITDAEQNVDRNLEQSDALKIQNLSLQDQVAFSTITLYIYQDQNIQHEMVANEKSINSYRPHIGLQILESLKTGWYIFEHLISFIVLLWPLFLIGFVGYFGYKKWKNKEVQ